MRCSECNKFVSFGDLETEEINIDVDGEEVVGEIRLMLPCAECGTELKEAILEFSIPIDHDCPLTGEEQHCEELVSNFELVNIEYDSFEGKEKYGNKTFKVYGVNMSAEVQCDRCDDIIVIKDSIQELAGNFEELI